MPIFSYKNIFVFLCAYETTLLVAEARGGKPPVFLPGELLETATGTTVAG